MPFFILAGSSKPHMYIYSDFVHFLEYGCHLLGMQHCAPRHAGIQYAHSLQLEVISAKYWQVQITNNAYVWFDKHILVVGIHV